MSSDAAAMSTDAPLFLTHAISKTDSLATIAVKYGVTIRDVKRANGGMITDATLHARASVRIPRTALAEGPPLPGGGGLTGAGKPETSRAGLEEMRENRGTSAGSLADARAAMSAGVEGGAGATRAFAGGLQVATKLSRVESGANVNEASSATARAPIDGAVRGTCAEHGGGVSAMTFQSRDRALMSPPTTKTASGSAVPLNAHVSAPSSSGASVSFPSVGARGGGTKTVAGFFDRVRSGVKSLAADAGSTGAGAGSRRARPTAFGLSGETRAFASERKGKGD